MDIGALPLLPSLSSLLLLLFVVVVVVVCCCWLLVLCFGVWGVLLGAWEPVAQIKEEDLFTTPLDEATHVIMFLSIGGAKGLARRFEEALRPGTVVVSCGFKLPGWTPFRRFSPSESKWLPVFMYRKDEEAVVPQR